VTERKEPILIGSCAVAIPVHNIALAQTIPAPIVAARAFLIKSMAIPSFSRFGHSAIRRDGCRVEGKYFACTPTAFQNRIEFRLKLILVPEYLY
jgi:hypothetical protein